MPLEPSVAQAGLAASLLWLSACSSSPILGDGVTDLTVVLGWDDPAAGKLSDRNLAKLDRLIAECAANGVYLNLNLHVGREYPEQPNVSGSRAFRFSKNLDRWHAAVASRPSAKA